MERAPLVFVAQGAGDPCWVEGVITDMTGDPLAGAEIEVWEADDDGLYDVQYGDAQTAQSPASRGRDVPVRPDGPA